MANTRLAADTAFVVHLRSYGFFHSGRERLRTQVLKRTWEHIPGSTLYGAVAAALIRLDGMDEGATPPESGPGDYHALLGAVKAQGVRFTPLLPVAEPLAGAGEWTGLAYCRQAQRLHAAGGARAHERALFHTTPHAPLARATEQIHSDQLFAFRTHRPLVDYYGFVFAGGGLEPLLRRALRLFPFIPVGGKGKFSLVEADLVGARSLKAFLDELQGQAQGVDGWLRLLTPMVLRDGQTNDLLGAAGREMVMTGLRRYRVWRTGRYYDAQQGEFGPPMGMEPGEGAASRSPLLAGGAESRAVLAVPERSRFQRLAGDDVARWFVEGVGNPSWTYLGWGQIVLEPSEGAEQ